PRSAPSATQPRSPTRPSSTRSKNAQRPGKPRSNEQLSVRGGPAEAGLPPRAHHVIARPACARASLEAAAPAPALPPAPPQAHQACRSAEGDEGEYESWVDHGNSTLFGSAALDHRSPGMAA